MLKELARDAKFNKQRFNQLKGHILNHTRDWTHTQVLDVGPETRFTRELRNIRCFIYDIEVHNTEGDLDNIFTVKETINTYKKYDIVLISHTLEHLFNPLWCLQQLKKCLAPLGVIIIALPQRPKFLWWDGHYHEIDHYRMQLLLKRAELKIMEYKKYRVWRKPSFYLSGIRPFLRLFWRTNSVYICMKQKGGNK